MVHTPMYAVMNTRICKIKENITCYHLFKCKLTHRYFKCFLFIKRTYGSDYLKI